MAKLLRIPFSGSDKIFCVACLLAMGWFTPGDSALYAQNTYAGCCPPYNTRDVGRPRVTYGGRVYLSFPNYDIFLGGAPTRLGRSGDRRGRVRCPRDLPQQPRDALGRQRVLLASGLPGRADHEVSDLQSRGRRRRYGLAVATKRRENKLSNSELSNGYPTGSYPTATYPPATYPLASPPPTYQTAYPNSYPGTNLNHSPMPNTVRFSGNAWGYEPATNPAATVIYESPGAIISPPVTPTTGRTEGRNE